MGRNKRVRKIKKSLADRLYDQKMEEWNESRSPYKLKLGPVGQLRREEEELLAAMGPKKLFSLLAEAEESLSGPGVLPNWRRRTPVHGIVVEKIENPKIPSRANLEDENGVMMYDANGRKNPWYGKTSKEKRRIAKRAAKNRSGR